MTVSAVPAGRLRPGAAQFREPRPSAVLLVTMLLLTFGLLMMTSASVEIAASRYGDPLYFLKRQLIFSGIGVGLMLMLMLVPINVWNRLGWLLLLGAYAMLVIVLLPGIGREVNGSTRWIDLGFFALQPSEPAKVLLVIYLASYLERHRERVGTTWIGFLAPLFLVGVAVALLQMEPDHGAMAILALAALCMVFLAGAGIWRVLSLLLLSAGSIAFLAYTQPYVVRRFTAFLDPWAPENIYGAGYQLGQAQIAFGRGGLFGAGVGNSIQKLDFLPEAHNDFLLAVIGEELGLTGVALMVLLFCVLVWHCFSIAREAYLRERFFAAYLAWGLGLLLAGQTMINIGVNLGLLPTKGLTLPFMSYGGASLIVCCGMIGLLLRIQYETECISAPRTARRRRLP